MSFYILQQCYKSEYRLSVFATPDTYSEINLFFGTSASKWVSRIVNRGTLKMQYNNNYFWNQNHNKKKKKQNWYKQKQFYCLCKRDLRDNVVINDVIKYHPPYFFKVVSTYVPFRKLMLCTNEECDNRNVKSKLEKL